MKGLSFHFNWQRLIIFFAFLDSFHICKPVIVWTVIDESGWTGGEVSIDYGHFAREGIPLFSYTRIEDGW